MSTPKKCLNCEKLAFKYSKYSNGNFCNRECAASYSTKKKRLEINKKVSKKLTGQSKGGILIEKKCLYCGNDFVVKYKHRNQVYCTITCRNNCSVYKQKLSENQTKRCENLAERIRLREIGRKGGFGKKGYTESGLYFQSSFERRVFEVLEEKEINFEPHKMLPNSSKISDLYLIDFDVWVELDGIDREKKKKWIGKDYDYWLEKLRIYEENKLLLKVFKRFEEFEEYLKILAP